eukprot:PLAT8519.1.p2 GENE.PLAT8519.1~~PLAT8519.1.p2  ORF type:complete len:249 (+),score=141.57 PLAT8519.1:2-748(+)
MGCFSSTPAGEREEEKRKLLPGKEEEERDRRQHMLELLFRDLPGQHRRLQRGASRGAESLQPLDAEDGGARGSLWVRTARMPNWLVADLLARKEESVEVEDEEFFAAARAAGLLSAGGEPGGDASPAVLSGKHFDRKVLSCRIRLSCTGQQRRGMLALLHVFDLFDLRGEGILLLEDFQPVAAALGVTTADAVSSLYRLLDCEQRKGRLRVDAFVNGMWALLEGDDERGMEEVLDALMAAAAELKRAV